MALNSGTIKDAAGNAATLTLASPGASNSLGNNKALIVDTSVPTISSVSLNAANSELTVTFAENVYDTDGGSGDLEAADFELSISGGVATVASTPTGITKTAQNIWILDVNISGTANGSETLSVVPAAGNVIFDLAGNAASTSQSNNTASLTEKILPTVTNVTSTTSDGSYKQGETIAITVVFSETVNVTGTPQLTLNNASGSNPAVSYSSGTGSNTLTFNYTIGSGETSSDLDYVATNSLALNSGTIKDAAGNAATLTLASPGASNSLGNNKALIVDTSVPTVTNVTSTTSDGSYKQGETIAIKVVFSETVNVTGTPQLTLETGGSDAVVNYSSGTGSNTLTFNYTIGSGETSSDLDYVATNSLALNSGTIKDAAGNAATLTLASPGASNSLGNNKALIVDTSVPTISSVSLNAANSELTVTFAENVYDTDGGSGDLEAADFELSISGGVATVASTPTGITKTAQNIWILDVNVSGTANGSETLSVVPAAGNVIFDLAGNAASTSQSNNTASLTEKILPTVTNVTSTTSDGSYKQGETIAITVVFSETVNVTGTPQLTLNNASGSNPAVDYSSGTGSNTLTFNYTIGSGETSSDLDYVATNSLALNSGTIKDAAGNAATLTLASPGASNSLGNNKALIVDTTVPTVTNVTSTTSDGSYKQGETIAIKVVFSETVSVTGTPQLTLETGGSDAVVNYSSGTGSNTLTFNYTIGSGETSSDLDYVATNSLALNSGTIKDAAGNAATLTLASPGASNSLGNNKALIVDTSVPTISSVSLNAANSELTVTFAENVYDTDGGSGDLEAADFELSISGGVATVASTPTGITKTAQNIWILDVNISGTANGSETLSVVPAAGNVIFDLAGNAASTSQSNNTASLTEKILPTVTNVTSTTSDGSYKQGETIAITVVFSETVNVTGTPQLTLNNASGSNPAVSYSSGTGSNTLTFNYTIGSGETSSDLDYVATNSLALNSGTIKDAAGNAATLTLASPGASNSLGNNKALIVDTTVPTVTNVTSTTSDGSYKQGETIAITVVFSETVNVTGTPQLTLNNASGSNPAVNYSSGTGSNTLTFNYTIGSGETSSDLDYVATNSLALNSGTIKDAAGNAATLTLASPGASNSLGNNKALIVDTSVPTISSVSLNAANSELTVTFAENVYDTDGGSGDLEAADFELSISGGVATVASTPTGITKTAQNIWILDVNVSGTANGSETLSVVPAAGNVIFDLAGNAASTSQSNNTASLTEKILPTVTNVTSTTSDGSYKQGETIAITVVFSETVNVTGTPQLTLENASGSNPAVDLQ